RKVIGPDSCSVPIRLLIGQPAHRRAERASFAYFPGGDVDQGDVSRANVEDIGCFGCRVVFSLRRRYRRRRGRDQTEDGTAGTLQERSAVKPGGEKPLSSRNGHCLGLTP